MNACIARNARNSRNARNARNARNSSMHVCMYACM